MKTVNKIKKNIVKQAIMEGKSYKRAMLEAGYTELTAHNSSNNKCVKICLEEIMNSFKKEEITPELVLSGLLNEYRIAKKSSDRQNALMLLGKYLAMFTDKQQLHAEILTKEEQSIISNYIQRNRIDKLT
jgi:hypothetical protein